MKLILVASAKENFARTPSRTRDLSMHLLVQVECVNHCAIRARDDYFQKNIVNEDKLLISLFGYVSFKVSAV